MKKKPLVRVWDIETGFNVVATHALFNKFPIRHRNILSERYIICGSWKTLGKTTTHSVSQLDDMARFEKDPLDDAYVVGKLYEMLEGTDAIIAHYGDQFDMKRFNARALVHGYDPLPKIIQIDTWKMANQKFAFNNNRLDYLGQYLKLGNKIHTDPDLWMDCLQGKKGAVRDMVTYNKQDVHLLEKVYLKLRPWVPAHVNHRLFDDRDICRHCGSDHIQYRGETVLKFNTYPSFQCQTCGTRDRSRTAIKRKHK